MKILHTSDWHLGQNFFAKSRKNEHQAFLRWLLQLIEQQHIDAVIIAGDIFDTGSPPSYARELYNQFVVDINRLNCSLVVLGGNHDSVSMLNESKQLLACLNTHVIARSVAAKNAVATSAVAKSVLARDDAAINEAEKSAEQDSIDDYQQQLICLPNREGQIGAIVCAIPFIRPRDVLHSVAGESSVDKQQQLAQAIKQHYAELYQGAKQQQAQIFATTEQMVPIIATGHLTALGVSSSESVRDIYIGSLEAFDASNFPPVDYLALGHIHRPQMVAKSEVMRYSGSPIALGFDELSQGEQRVGQASNKQVVLVQFIQQQEAQQVKVQVEPIMVPVFQSMASLTGNLQQISEQLQELSQSNVSDKDETIWLSIQVKEQDYLSDLQQKMQQLTQDLNVEVLQLRRARGKQLRSLNGQNQETLAELTPFDVFEKRLQLESFDSDDEQARKLRISQHFQQLVNQVCLGDAE